MCGFVGMFDLNSGSVPLEDGLREELRSRLLDMSKKIRHRGPDWSGVYTGANALLSHERLSIVDPLSGKQPLISEDGNVILAVNGEIYNHQEIRKRYEGRYTFKTQSDCEVILPLYQEKGAAFLEDLSGIFAFALYDKQNDVYLVARDHIGIIPLYQGWDEDGRYYVASELKALEGTCCTIEEFPNGCYFYSKDSAPVKWYERDWTDYAAVQNNVSSIAELRAGLETAVKKQLMSDVPYGVLLSGGLDSSIIAAVTKKFSARRVESGGTQEAWWPQLHSFAVGLEGAPDLLAARKAAEFIGTVHHEVHFTIQEALDALSDVIYHLETYDITTVRASTPMYLLARVIKSMGIKMVLSGEGADELFGGYLYFHKAPDAKEFHEETVRKLGKLHLYDCLRANKALAAWGVEGRVPFLDKEFIDVAMRLNPEDKMSSRCEPGTKGAGRDGRRMEKWILRKAFEEYLPESIAWRQKEQFSDGVGYSWIDTLKKIAEERVSDQQFAAAAKRFPINTPLNKEEYYYRSLFAKFFPSETAAKTVPHEASVACSTAKALEWDASFKNMNDPSGRAVSGVHDEAYSK
ncbi:asparagine synthase B [Treponema brennaborense]|uniref:asparagine synthase (glutamine-hydrolyzing) n=1 Tax=Treponema brennaborense (strain DSM 12168 / CIP 105900 / DD5/3) TaxID=906968 RepID=F4LQB4_TREBD|nr:asparagine synthase B [Treponema brennaborense]AEE16135.1 asparagine synthase (glutamine-hydrolyzing) [Treponema brennaborense DSM 12168]